MDDLALGHKDGCRVGTIAEAYPIVLEIVRQAAEELPIRDQAGQELRELIDFKVHLTDPTDAMVPAFYQEDANSLEEYFKKQFLEHDGLFGRPLQTSGQLEAVLAHLAQAVSDSHLQFATRRAILVIPHEIQQGADIAPLGLVSIRCIPRFLATRIRLHYSYTWRTVESFVGFPFSIYGSVRFSQHLTEEVRRRAPAVSRRIEMGEVSYIAHSLHIFMDDYGQNIAQRIVDDASI